MCIRDRLYSDLLTQNERNIIRIRLKEKQILNEYVQYADFVLRALESRYTMPLNDFLYSCEDYQFCPHAIGIIEALLNLSLIHISEPTRPLYISYAVFCLKKKKTTNTQRTKIK
eukprot:TRINITY_DN8956_c0_g1_i2.p3 TRINITY_DN8956_c0_g1~~TRINITY_DN8956_c0_g1_i2.p3  ORF type:complete len:114 (-),score=18.94 TRINITY_DN8956_c0_g1_i2:53-394(-)